MFVVELIIIWLGIFLAWYWIKPRYKLPPVFPGAMPLLGHALQLSRDPIGIWAWEKKVHEFSLQCGGIATVFIGTKHFYFISDPDDSLHIANTYLNKTYLYNFAKEMYNFGLNTADESTWKPHRKLLNPSFNMQVLNSFMDIFNDQARTLVTQLDEEAEKGAIDLEMYLANHVLKTTCHISSLKKKHDSLVKTLKDISNEVIFKRKLQMKQNKEDLKNDLVQNSDKFRPLLDRILDLTDTEDAFTDDEIRDHVNTVIAAAYETSSKSMLFTLILIGSHENVQSQVFEELYEVFGDDNRSVNKVDLQKLVYLEDVIKESLRLYPPVPRVGRHNQSDVKLKHYTLAAGSTCVISAHAINRHPMWGADADQFRPERWLDPASLPYNPNAFASFSLGKRNCIGKSQAMMMMKITLAHILRHYRVTSSSHDLKTRCDLIQSPAKGHNINLKLRK